MRGFCDKLRAILLIRELNSLSVDIIYVHSVTYGGSGAGNWNARKFQVPWPSHVFMSKTRSGLVYKEDDTKDTKDTMAELKVQELLQMLIEDRKKREMEISEERERREKEFDAERRRREEEREARERENQKRLEQMQAYMDNLAKLGERREKEFDAERRRREEEREARERESQKRLEQMQAYMDNLAKLVEGTAVQRSRGPEITVKLVPLNEKDDVEAYLITFERIMAAHNISKDRWSHYLTSQLTGKAQLAFAAISPSDSGNYEKIKAAILIRYGINDEEYRRRFRSERRKDGETNRELAVRLMEWQAKWLKECHTVEDVLNAVGKEQFLNTLPTDKKLWVLERKPETGVKAGELADEYEQARRPEMESLASSTSKPNRVGSRECHYCGKSGHAEEDCYKRKREESQRSRGTQCYHCKKQGLMSWECPEKSMVCKELRDKRRKGGRPMYKTGKVEGQKVTDILLDTGCSRTMVRRNLVAMEKIIVGRVATITCAHGDTKLHPLALVEVELDGSHIQVEAALSEELPVSVLLGTDVPELTHLISGTGSSINLVSQEQVMVVMTRAKAKQQLEEELIRKEKELLSGAQSNTLVRVNEPVACDNVVPSRSESEAGQSEQQSPRKNSKLTKDQRREIRKKAQETEKSREGGNSEYPDITIEDLKKLQAEDPTLAEVLRAADRSANDRNESVAEYFRREGLVYRRWTPKGRSSTFQVEQLVLPKRCRGTVLKLAHDVPLGGHLGKEKTGCRLLRRFYWPTLFKDVAEFCRGCPTCQRSAQRRIKRAPFGAIPIHCCLQSWGSQQEC